MGLSLITFEALGNKNNSIIGRSYIANTYYYDNDGQKKNSSAPHSINSIIGVVDKQEELI